MDTVYTDLDDRVAAAMSAFDFSERRSDTLHVRKGIAPFCFFEVSIICSNTTSNETQGREGKGHKQRIGFELRPQ